MNATSRTGTKVETNCEREAEFFSLAAEEPGWSTGQQGVEGSIGGHVRWTYARSWQDGMMERTGSVHG